jgi:cellulose synthase/poly-beta-1,6-N-acetylglucosamine synthase-like glycosyltransferase
MALIVFWAAAMTIAYTYLGFPLLVIARGRLQSRPHRSGEVTPSVTVVIAARNEVAAIAGRLENLLSLDYPTDRLEVVIASDGSEDGTDDVVRSYRARGVQLVARPRCGKAAALNAAVAAASGEIIVFSDANSRYAPDALRALVRPFADDRVGGVAGDQRYSSHDDVTGVAAGERGYWSFDRMLKEAESRAGSTISATGAIYAIRRALFRPVPEGVTDDFVTSIAVIAQGYRLVFAPDAIAFEPVASTGEVEFGRKVRIMTRGLRGVFVMRELLNPRRYGFYAVQLLSHKVLRRLMVFPLVAVAIASPRLRRRGGLYRIATVAQAGFYGAGAIGLALAAADRSASRPPKRRPRLLTLPAYFCMVNIAALRAVWNLLCGHRIDRWEPARPTPQHPDPAVGEPTLSAVLDHSQ